MLNPNYFAERMLLRRCAADDAAAQRRFAGASYRNQVFKTAAQVNLRYNLPLGSDEVHDVCLMLINEIYKAHAQLPSWRHSLYRRIEDYVFAAVVRYLEKAVGPAPPR